MNYYERHLGDYAKDTGHLTMLEHGAYSLLLDRYYGTELGIPADQAHRIARARSTAEKEAVDTVLSEFFTLIDGVWIKQRVEEEIEKAQGRIGAARRNGGKGGRPPKPKPETQEKPSGLSLGSEIETGSKALHTPDTKHQTPDTKDKKARAPALALADLVVDGLSPDTAQGWIDHRKAKKAPLTPLAWAGFKAAVAKAPGWTVEAAVLKAIARNWTSFEASWVTSEPQNGRRQGAEPIDTDTRNAEARRLLGFDIPPEDDHAAG